MSPAAGPPLIRTEGLTRRYRLGREIIEALHGVSLVVDRGEYAAIMGPSGSGKSTLMNILGCLDTPDEGRYWLNGRLVSDMRDGCRLSIAGNADSVPAKTSTLSSCVGRWRRSVPAASP